MITAGNVFAVGVVALLVAICGLFWVLHLFWGIDKVWRLQVPRISDLERDRANLVDRVRSLETRCDALERKPPVVNVTNVVEPKR